MTRSEPPAEVIRDIFETALRRIALDGLPIYEIKGIAMSVLLQHGKQRAPNTSGDPRGEADPSPSLRASDIVARLRTFPVGFLADKPNPETPAILKEAADEIESLRASSSLGGIEGGVQREDALTAGALVEKQAVDGLCQLAYAAWCLADDSEDLGDGFYKVDHDNFVKLCDAFDVLDDLPDDQPGYTMEVAAKARWALRAFLPGEGVAEDNAEEQVRGVGAEPHPPISSPAGALTAEKADEIEAVAEAIFLKEGRAKDVAWADADKVLLMVVWGWDRQPKQTVSDYYRDVARDAIAAFQKATGGDTRGDSALPPSSARERREIIEECASLCEEWKRECDKFEERYPDSPELLDRRKRGATCWALAKAIRSLSSDGRGAGER